MNGLNQTGFLPLSLSYFFSLGFYVRHLQATYATLFLWCCIAGENSPFMVTLGGKCAFGGVGKAIKGQIFRKTPCGQTHKLCYARLPGL